MKFILILFLVSLSSLLIAQQSDSQLAYSYYQNKEYDKAADVFLKLYQRTRASYYLDYHIICLINAKKYDEAEVTLKKFLKTDDNNKDFLINLGYIYEQQGKLKKAEEYFGKAIKKLIPHNNDIQNLAYKFRNIREYEWATKTYLKGRELLKKPDAFLVEMGDNYMMERNYTAMFEQFEQSLRSNPGNLNSIISKLNFARNYDVNNNVDTVIRTQLHNISQSSSYPPVFDELSVWFALQTHDYVSALHYATLLNNKVKNKLNIYQNIAREASQARHYDISISAYNKILERGKENNNFYSIAQREILSVQYAALTDRQASAKEYYPVALGCEELIKENGYTNVNADIILLLADIYAYKMDKPDTANTILQKGESIHRLPPNTIYTIKSKRADLLAYINNPWEATILYTQIEKANPNNDIGYQAKLKKAKMAYYQGDLLWAKGQFDVLKGSTSKLTANDAIQISHFINSNYEEGGDNQLLEKIAKTEFLIYRKKYKEALPLLDSLSQDNNTTLRDYACLLKSRLLIDKGQKEEATLLLEELKQKSTTTYIQAEAIFQLAKLKLEMHQKKAAMELYKLLVSDYSGSIYSIEAGKRYRELEKN